MISNNLFFYYKFILVILWSSVAVDVRAIQVFSDCVFFFWVGCHCGGWG